VHDRSLDRRLVAAQPEKGVPVSAKLHYSSWVDEGETLCGRVITARLRVTGNLIQVDCVRCLSSQLLDDMLGNMTHPGT
jgi:hypothetical protein